MIPSRLEALLFEESSSVALARLFGDAGKALYLVGGTLRDAFLGRPHEDLDLATDARPDEIKTIAGGWATDLYLAGERFGTVGVIRDGVLHEITTFRSEVYEDESRKPRVRYSNDIVEDLSRRDFTVNAVALRVPVKTGFSPDIVDPYGGLADLGAGLLRTPLDPAVAFGDDPLRMLRMFRFVSTLGFEASADAVKSTADMASRLEIVSAERLRAEIDKLIVGSNVGAALRGLVETGLATFVIPELPALALEQDPMHRHKDVLAHTIAVVEKTSSEVLELRLAALFHDIGKPSTRAFGEEGVSFHHHEAVGARMAEERMRRMRYPKRMVGDVSRLVFLHMRPHTYEMGWTDSAVRRYVRDAGPLLTWLNELVRCDVTTRNRSRARAIEARIDELEARIEELSATEELAALRPPIDGNDVMSYLGLEPGPAVGEIMGILTEYRIENGPYDRTKALELLDKWQASHR